MDNTLWLVASQTLPTEKMSRIEYQHPTEPKAMAIGVDQFMVPGDSDPRTFLQIWDTTTGNQPTNEEGFNNLLVNRLDVDVDQVITVAKQYGFKVPEVEVFELFD